MLCKHCHKAPANRPRGLCWSCYYTAGVRALYPSTSKFARRGLGLGGAPLRPAQPTSAQPGSPEKIAVLAQRVALRQELWHPQDATMYQEAALLAVG